MSNIMQMMQGIKNPQVLIQQMMQNSQLANNPIAKNAFEMYQKGDTQGLNKLADNLCKEKGINRQEFEKQIMSQIGMN